MRLSCMRDGPPPSWKLSPSATTTRGERRTSCVSHRDAAVPNRGGRSSPAPGHPLSLSTSARSAGAHCTTFYALGPEGRRHRWCPPCKPLRSRKPPYRGVNNVWGRQHQAQYRQNRRIAHKESPAFARGQSSVRAGGMRSDGLALVAVTLLAIWRN